MSPDPTAPFGEWTLLGLPAGSVATPAGLPAEGAGWRPAVVPGTVASALVADLDHPGDLDELDWWYRTTLRAPAVPADHRLHLCFDGLATLAEVWLEGEVLLTSRDMFTPHRVALPAGAEGALVVCFRSVAAELARKHPRPRWKTALVDHQNLRWVRTSLLGRIPGWTPRLPAIGPGRAVRVEATPPVAARSLVLHPTVRDGVAWLDVRVEVDAPLPVTSATLFVGDRPLALRRDADGALTGAFSLPEVPLWWPHTHGTPHLEPYRLVVEAGAGPVPVASGTLGFRSVEIDRGEGGVRLRVNGRTIFARGACWTPEDVRSLDGAPERVAATLDLARAAGANLLRVGGTMTWESDTFYAGCDERGLLVWQDLPFANMDYPFGDPGFAALVEEELTAQLPRLSRHPCLAVYCGGSEIEQQAAMLGLPASEWSGPFFQVTAPALCARLHPGVPYFPSTPTGGALPFHTGEGLTHYYGVGAYRRPLSDVRAARVRFTPECLGFANVPDPELVEAMAGGGSLPPHHPAWKVGVPRDSGAGWDFEDIRDHYLASLYGVDPVALRSTHLERYLALSRAVTGELMLRVFAEWRRPGSGCGGALVWFWKDLRPGAGWGVVDSTGRPKTAWWYLRRAWAARAVLLTDEGLDGLGVHVHNEHGEALEAEVELELWRGRRQVARASAPITLAPYAAVTLSGDALIGRFTDLSWAYRFGPPGHDVVVARLRRGDEVLHEDSFFPAGYSLPVVGGAELVGSAAAEPDGTVVLTLQAATFLQTVTLASPGYRPDDNSFHLAPGGPRRVRFTPLAGPRAFRVYVGALNLEGTLTVRAE